LFLHKLEPIHPFTSAPFPRAHFDAIQGQNGVSPFGDTFFLSLPGIKGIVALLFVFGKIPAALIPSPPFLFSRHLGSLKSGLPLVFFRRKSPPDGAPSFNQMFFSQKQRSFGPPLSPTQ